MIILKKELASNKIDSLVKKFVKIMNIYILEVRKFLKI